MYKYLKYDEWISNQKVIGFVDFLLNQEQNGSSIPITFEMFMEMPRILFSFYFYDSYDWKIIGSDFNNYRDFINRVEKEFCNKVIY